MSQVQRMSVIAKKNDKSVKVYVKGAPEVLRNICDPSSIPSNYSQYNDFYANKGLRILSLAVKDISHMQFDFNRDKNSGSPQGLNFKNLSCQDKQILLMKRLEQEKDLKFVGFVFFENPIKSDAISTLTSLNNAEIMSKIVTGDNALTAASVARKCDIIKDNQDILIVDIDENNEYVNFLRLGDKPFTSPTLPMQVDPFKSHQNNPNSTTAAVPQSAIDRNSVQYIELNNLNQNNNQSQNQNNENNNSNFFVQAEVQDRNTPNFFIPINNNTTSNNNNNNNIQSPAWRNSLSQEKI